MWLIPQAYKMRNEQLLIGGTVQDFLPVIAFIGVYVIARIMGFAGAMYLATAAIMITVSAQIIYFLWKKKPIEKKYWATFGVIMVLGSITLILKNDLFIKLKPTVLNVIIAGIFLGSQFWGKENLTQKMLNAAFDMDKNLWQKLNLAWVAFFIFEGIVNAFVAFNFSNDFYVGFKFWGLLGLTMIFMLGQVFVLRKYLRTDLADKDKKNG